MSTTHEHAARAAKAMSLIDALIVHAGLGTPSAVIDAAALLALAQQLPRRLWDDVADAAGVRSPSDTTIAVVIRALERRVRDENVDPFDGLPT